MNNLKQKSLAILSFITHFIVYCAITIAIVLSGFALYVKINTFDVSFLVDYFKKEQLIDEETTVGSLFLEFDGSFILVAKDIALKAENVNVSLSSADVELSRASLIRGQFAAKRITIDNAQIELNLDNLLLSSAKTAEAKPANYHSTLKQMSYLKIAKWTKSAYITKSNIKVTYNNELQTLKDISLNFYKSQSGLEFAADGIYNLNNNKSPIHAVIHIDDNSDDIEFEISADKLATQDIINTFYPNDKFMINGEATVILNAKITKDNKIENINGSTSLENGYVAINNLYENKLTFKELSTKFNYSLNDKKISLDSTKLIDTNNNEFNITGDFSHNEEPVLNITVENKAMDALDIFKYIPDLDFKKWLTQHITAGDASNVKFGFYGPLRPILDGEGDNPYFDIKANFENLTINYLDGLPDVTQGKGNFTMFKKNINITIDSAMQSAQTIKRGSVTIAPLFEEKAPLITVKALSKGSIEDVLDVLNKKLNLNQEEFFSNYSGTQEAQSTIELYLDRLNDVDAYNPQKESFIKFNVIVDIPEVVGVDPAFNQRFKATDAIIKITEEDFTLDASGFMDENPFSVVLQEKLLDFGKHTKLKINSNFDSYLLRDYLDIPSFNLSGLVHGELMLEKNKDTWNFDLNADLEDSLLNFGFLNYTKPFSQKGTVAAKGYYNLKENILNLQKTNLNLKTAKANGSAKILLNNLPASTVKFTDVVIDDRTNLKEFSLSSNILAVKGKSLDIRPFKMATNNTSKEDDETKQAIDKFNIRLDQLYLDDEKGFANVSIILNTSKNIAGLIKASDSKESQEFYVRFTPDKNNPDKIDVESLVPHVGNYLRRADLYDNMNSGHGIIFGNLMFKDNNLDTATLTVNVKRFQLVRAPLLAKALASISLEQLLSNKEGILFDDLRTDISYADSIIKLQDGKIKGPSLGILFHGAYDNKTKTTDIKGTFVPVVKLNSIVTNIPVLGYILTGSQGALSGADFKVYGTQGEQNVSVSPLSVLTPGIVKDLFDTVAGDKDSKAIKKARKKADYAEKQQQKEQEKKKQEESK